jgi:hypothetical protein
MLVNNVRKFPIDFFLSFFLTLVAQPKSVLHVVELFFVQTPH